MCLNGSLHASCSLSHTMVHTYLVIVHMSWVPQWYNSQHPPYWDMWLRQNSWSLNWFILKSDSLYISLLFLISYNCTICCYHIWSPVCMAKKSSVMYPPHITQTARRSVSYSYSTQVVCAYLHYGVSLVQPLHKGSTIINAVANLIQGRLSLSEEPDCLQGLLLDVPLICTKCLVKSIHVIMAVTLPVDIVHLCMFLVSFLESFLYQIPVPAFWCLEAPW